MHNALVIWELNPASLLMYLVTVDELTLGKLLACHGKLVNEEPEFEYADWIQLFLAEQVPIYESDVGQVVKLAGGPITVIHTGFAL